MTTRRAAAKLPGLDAAQKRDWLRLLRSENVGPVSFRALINRYGSASEALSALPELSTRGGLRRRIRICPVETADAELAAAHALGATLVAAGERAYPDALLHVEGAPPLVYAVGNLSALQQPMVAIVGSRNCSAAGRRLAQTIAAALGAAGMVVVSGLARGVDSAAHSASLATGTVAILAGGHAHIYPPENVGLAEDIKAAGALLSEMPPQWVPRGKDFPRRNRIISGVSHGVVVIEAASRSGTLITARFAAEQGREVFAVPGSPLDPRAEGTNRLIRQGATLTRSAEDVLEVLQPMLKRPPAGDAPLHDAADDLSPVADLDDNGRRGVQELLGPAPVEIDELVRQSGLAVGAVMLALVELELAGRLERHPGQRVALGPQ